MTLLALLTSLQYVNIRDTYTTLSKKIFRENFLSPKCAQKNIRPGRVNRITFSPGLTGIGSREKRNCSFDDVETYKRYRVALS